MPDKRKDFDPGRFGVWPAVKLERRWPLWLTVIVLLAIMAIISYSVWWLFYS